jgi:hypothetical protein
MNIDGLQELTMNETTSSTKPDTTGYATHLNVLFPSLASIDVPALVGARKDAWYNQTLCQVNNSVVRLGVMQGEYHWHKHDNDDPSGPAKALLTAIRNDPKNVLKALAA